MADNVTTQDASAATAALSSLGIGAGVTGLPVTPNGGDTNPGRDSGSNKFFKL